MNIVSRLFIERGARLDARGGLDSIEDRIAAELGPRPKLDTTMNHEHAELARCKRSSPHRGAPGGRDAGGGCSS
jgi:hypothetical protein